MEDINVKLYDFSISVLDSGQLQELAAFTPRGNNLLYTPARKWRS
jgi:hypothetical protein